MREYLVLIDLTKEFTHIATTERNPHIESISWNVKPDFDVRK